MTKPLQLIFALFVQLLLTCTASSETAKKHTYRILFIDRPTSAPQTLQLFDGTTSQEVELPKMNLSKVYELPAGNLDLALLSEAIGDPDDLPVGAPTVKVPEEITDFYLLVSSDPSNDVAPVSLQVVSAGTGSYLPGQTLWLNMTDHEITGKLGSEELFIEPKSQAITNPPAKEDEAYPVNIGYRIPGKEPISGICETAWTHNSHNRNLAILLSIPGARTPRVFVFPDYRKPSP